MSTKTNIIPMNCMHCFFYDTDANEHQRNRDCLKHNMSASNVNSCASWKPMIIYLERNKIPSFESYDQYFLDEEGIKWRKGIDRECEAFAVDTYGNEEWFLRMYGSIEKYLTRFDGKVVL